MWIEAGQHAADRIRDQALIGDRIDVFDAHPLEGIAKQSEQPVRIGPVTVLGKSVVDNETEPDMPCDQTGGRADCHTSQKHRAEHQGGAKATPGVVHTHNPLSTPSQCRRSSQGIDSDDYLTTAGGIQRHHGAWQRRHRPMCIPDPVGVRDSSRETKTPVKR